MMFGLSLGTFAQDPNNVPEKETNLFSIVYHAGTFEEPRYSASYGIMYDYLNVGESNFGLTCALEGNWGLAREKEGGVGFLAGPNIGWAFGQKNDIRLFIPVTYALGMHYNEYKKETEFAHSCVIMPTFVKMFGSSFGIRAGLSFTTDFSHLSTGFIVGLVF